MGVLRAKLRKGTGKGIGRVGGGGYFRQGFCKIFFSYNLLSGKYSKLLLTFDLDIGIPLEMVMSRFGVDLVVSNDGYLRSL